MNWQMQVHFTHKSNQQSPASPSCQIWRVQVHASPTSLIPKSHYISSFHIRDTTKLLVAGVPPDVVKALGRWSSDAFLVYWQSLSELAPLYVANLSSCSSTT
ncbi:hypothetical protein M422DRAFT_277184 [Sphaerobolus stellatus SS14]|uniref:Uncharacterized protein n=1 Tax=Sphaerobolus stellatus (strain SS14) TaxID=990650 RepID=A0A0C9U0D2_SPHS4|nr:hypothetical protein M422DRAFT_277184 [Sphaerobolus stellatus SS14]